VREVLTRHDILFIADEVITGFGRTGSMFATNEFALKPDIITLAKDLSSAYLPISAVMVGKRVTDVIVKGSTTIGSFGHGFTYSGHPVAAPSHAKPSSARYCTSRGADALAPLRRRRNDCSCPSTS
jgi:4-aminobutyrate---pyruvate transaminase